MMSMNKYSPNYDVATLAKQIAVERVNWYSSQLFAQELVRQGNLEVQLAHAMEKNAYRVTMKMSLPGVQKNIMVTWPATWWDHFKTTWPVWVRKVLFWVKPPRWTGERHVTGTVFPGLKMPDKYGQLVFYDMTPTGDLAGWTWESGTNVSHSPVQGLEGDEGQEVVVYSDEKPQGVSVEAIESMHHRVLPQLEWRAGMALDDPERGHTINGPQARAIALGVLAAAGHGNAEQGLAVIRDSYSKLRERA